MIIFSLTRDRLWSAETRQMKRMGRSDFLAKLAAHKSSAHRTASHCIHRVTDEEATGSSDHTREQWSAVSLAHGRSVVCSCACSRRCFALGCHAPALRFLSAPAVSRIPPLPLRPVSATVLRCASPRCAPPPRSSAWLWRCWHAPRCCRRRRCSLCPLSSA